MPRERIGLNGPIEDYAKFCQMLLNKGEFNGHRILSPETVELMTTINRLPGSPRRGKRISVRARVRAAQGKETGAGRV